MCWLSCRTGPAVRRQRGWWPGLAHRRIRGFPWLSWGFLGFPGPAGSISQRARRMHAERSSDSGGVVRCRRTMMRIPGASCGRTMWDDEGLALGVLQSQAQPAALLPSDRRDRRWAGDVFHSHPLTMHGALPRPDKASSVQLAMPDVVLINPRLRPRTTTFLPPLHLDQLNPPNHGRQC